MNILREYSFNYIKNNKTTSISIIVAAFIASVLLSLTCGIFYNIWADEVRLIKLEEGDWHGKLAGNISDEAIKKIESYANIREIRIQNDEASKEKIAFLYFYHPNKIYEDIPKIYENITAYNENTLIDITYHNKLLAKYFIFSKAEGNTLPLIVLVYLFVLLTAALALILIIHNAFGVSMNARMHQLGILQSIGATPKQLRIALVNEAMLLCLIPIISGVISGIGLCYAFMSFIKSVANSVRRYDLIFQYHPFILLTALILSLLTVWFSARIPAKKISRLNPLAAIKYGVEESVEYMNNFSFLSKVLGIEGELARKSLYVRRKAFRTSAVSLTLSFLAFSSFLNLETISSISTKYTFFERYKTLWDLMVSVDYINDSQKILLSEIRNIPETSECISYQKLTTYTKISKEMLSNELLELGGLERLPDSKFKVQNGYYIIEVPMLVLDDVSFKNYCSKVNIDINLFTSSDQSGVILINKIWDNINSNRKNKKMIPFIKAENDRVFELYENLSSNVNDQRIISTKVIREASELPLLREEFPNFSLIQVMSESAYKNTKNTFSASKYYFNIVAASKDDIWKLETKVDNLLKNKYEYTLDNRLAKEQSNLSIRNAYKIVIGCLSILLAIIGLANVLSNSLGHIYQRQKEFVRYITIGLSPSGVKRVLFTEAFILSLKPILTSLLINIPLVIFGLRKSLIPLNDFIEQMPIIPIFSFAIVIILAINFAYYLGWKKMYNTNWISVLKDDTII
jgi:putative ABC transport system permease protein